MQDAWPHRKTYYSTHTMSQGLTSPFPSKGGIEISQLGFGAMGLHAFYTNKVPKQEDVDAVLDEVVKTHPNPVMIDTAEVYSLKPGNGDNERGIGAWLKKTGQRKNVFLATKFGIGANGVSGTKEDAIKACNGSLERLGVDYIDLYYNHRPDRVNGVEGTFQGLKELKDQGKIKHVGCSEYNLDELRRANAIVHIDAVQIELSPWTPEPFTNGIVEWCEQNGTAVVAYSPIGRGALANRFKTQEDIPEDDWRRHNPRFQGENFNTNMKLVADIEKIGADQNATAAQVTLAWLMAQSKSIFPIPGTTNVSRVQENAGAAKLKLSKEQVDQITKLVSNFTVAGDRYPEAFKANLAF
ncbi:unnamed protein product [Sympodiomycopsis kandeliae]